MIHKRAVYFKSLSKVWAWMRQPRQSRAPQRLKTHKTSMQDPSWRPSNLRTFPNPDTPVCTLYDLTKMSFFGYLKRFRRSPDGYFCSSFMEIHSMATINCSSFEDQIVNRIFTSFVRFTSDTFYNTLRSPPGTQIVAHTQKVTSLSGREWSFSLFTLKKFTHRQSWMGRNTSYCYFFWLD